MGKVLPFKQPAKRTVPPQELGRMEKQIRQHTESRGALSAETRHVADTSTGEVVELDRLRRMSVHEIYTKITANFAKKDEAARAKALAGMGFDAKLPEATVATEAAEPKSADAAEQALHDLMRQLAEDIYDAIERCHKSLAIIKPDSINSNTTSRLDEKGDANFLVAAGEGKALFESLKSQNVDFRVAKENSYGFVLENEALGFKAMFIYQERLNADGSPKQLEDIKDHDTRDEDQNRDNTTLHSGQQAANNSNFGNSGKLAA